MILVTGARGQLGQAVLEEAARRGIEARGLSRAELDVTDASQVRGRLREVSAGCIVNCAAWTAVDDAEDHPQEAWAANAWAPWLLARSGIPLLHVSTDYVFSGEGSRPWEVGDECRPLSVYGLTKRQGETAVLESGCTGAVVRTAWVCTARPGTKNFLHAIRRAAGTRPELRVVDDQRGSPTFAEDLARVLLDLFEKGVHREPVRILHAANSGETTWCGFARTILEETGLSKQCRVLPITSDEWPARAHRPSMSVLSLSSLSALGITTRPWREALRESLRRFG